MAKKPRLLGRSRVVMGQRTGSTLVKTVQCTTSPAQKDKSTKSSNMTTPKQNKLAWHPRHARLAMKLGFSIDWNGTLIAKHEGVKQFVLSSPHWLCERARVEMIRRKLLSSS